MNHLNIATIVNNMPDEARLPALRKIVNSSIAAIFGAIRQHLRDEQRKERSESETHEAYGTNEIVNELGRASLDQRSETDEFVRGQEAADKFTDDLGYTTGDTPYTRAEKMHAVFCWANSACRTLATSIYEEPLTPNGMLKFMIDRTALPSDAILKAWADAAGCTLDDIKKMKVQLMNEERETLLRDSPSIIAMFDGFGDWKNAGEEFDGEDAVTNLAPLQQHQLGLKMLSGLFEGYNSVLKNAMRRNTTEGLSARPIILAEINSFVPLIKQYENDISDDIAAAMESGRRVASIEDFKSQLRSLPKAA